MDKVLSVKIPRDAYRKLEKLAEATQFSITDVASFFLTRGCKQPAKKSFKKAKASSL